MKKLIPIVIAFVAAAACVDMLAPRTELRDYADVMEEELNRSPMVRYTDSLFGFSVDHPACFAKEQGGAYDSTGSVRFIYNNVSPMILDCYVCRNDHAGDADGGIGALAGALQARHYKARGGYILSGPFYDNGRRIEGYNHYTKCMAKGNLWAIYTLVYPLSHRQRLSRLFSMIDRWEPWNDID